MNTDKTKKLASRFLVTLYPQEDVGLDLIASKMAEGPLQDRAVSRSSAVRSLIQSGMKRYKISKEDLTAAIVKKQNQSEAMQD